MTTCFMDVDHTQIHKHGQAVAGDVFLSRKLEPEGRIIAVLSDGMGSGVKANVLATLTATMAANFTAGGWAPEAAARRIMATLPVCSVRQIAYATFSIVDIAPNGTAQVIEFGNPAFRLFRSGGDSRVPAQTLRIPVSGGRDETLRATALNWRQGDRLVFFSDGVTQAGMGTAAYPLGWDDPGVTGYVQNLIDREPELSARELSRRVCQKAQELDGYRAKDDITCGVVYFRRPRTLLVVTGPPVDRDNDARLAGRVRDFQGRTVVAGGTTAAIVARELGVEVQVDLDHLSDDVPPLSTMAGVDLVTEGIITLATANRFLETGEIPAPDDFHAATRLVQLLLDSDIIHFLVGTRINEVHQDPAMPEDLEIRRNIVKKMAALLEGRYLKATQILYI